MSASASPPPIGPADPWTASPVSVRARGILQALHARFAQSLANPLKLTMVELERELFRQAERTASHMQADLHAEMQRVRSQGERFETSMISGLADALALLPAPERKQDAGEPAELSLALVEHIDIDRDIALHDIARRESLRCGTSLQLLAQRFGVLAARPAFEIEQIPIGPHALCRILRDTGETLGLRLGTQLLLYRAFEAQMRDRLVELLERANALLAHEGVLPGLVYLPYLGRRSPRRRPAGPPDAASPGAPSAPAGMRPSTSWAGQGPAASWHGAMLGGHPGAGPPLPAPGGPATAPASTGDEGHAQDLARLRQWLDVARSAPAGTSPAPPRPATLSQALGLLQARSQAGHPMPPAAGRSIRDVRQQLLAMLREAHGPQADLSAQDHDTFDLLGLLYGEVAREVKPGSPAAGLLERLQVPVARAALADPTFFVRDRHPARELLNAVAESGATWLAEDDTDPQLLQELARAVDQVVDRYQGDDAVFEQAHRQVHAHREAQARKAEMAERRHVEAARGKERLELAKRLAGDSIDRLCEQAGPPRFVQTLLRQAWSDVLTLTLLRQGESSGEWEERRKLTARIAEATCRPAGGTPDTALGGEIEQALVQVGYPADEAAAIARRLSTPGGQDDATSRTELAARLKARPRLGGVDGTPSTPAAPRTPAEQACHDQLRTLPFGTWFEFLAPAQGTAQRRRLSWYSPVTDHALFVNQRGQKAGEYSLDALARMMADGRLRIVTEERSRSIDRAWQAAVRMLRSLAAPSQPASPQEPSA
ncbi:MAG: DUF1631 domain-containing protein [Gammaproteobacteria bacterium]